MPDIKNTENQEATKSPLYKKVVQLFEKPGPKVAEELKDEPLWIQQQRSGKVHIMPPRHDKNMMLSLMTEDPELYEIFNDVADRFTRKWDGFHQIGHSDGTGLTAWELWKKPDVSDNDLLEQMKKEMLDEVATRTEWY
jgi:hypothetical protein